MLSAEDFKKLKPPIKKVDVPELGGEVGIRKLNGVDALKLRNLKGNEVEVACHFLALVLADEDGNRLFDTSEQLHDLPLEVLDKLCSAAGEYNNLNPDEAKKN